MDKQFDLIAIGDTVTDEFIELEDVRIDSDKDEGDKGYREICFRFGDKVSYKDAVMVYAVGNAANAAVSGTRLGLTTAFVTDIGDDELADKKLDALSSNGVNTVFVEKHNGMESNHHYVLRFGAERTILIKHHEYPYALPKDLPAAHWFYFSSIGKHGVEYHHSIAEFIKAHPESKLAFQPGTLQIALGYEKIKDVYKVSEVFFCNKEESQRILETKEDDIKKLLEGIHDLGPKIAVITDGIAGAYASDGTAVWFVPMYPDPKPPVDRTGAGDAFSSTFTAALALGSDIPTALSWGPINSMSVVQYIGAQEGLLIREKIEELLKNAPKSYRVEKIS